MIKNNRLPYVILFFAGLLTFAILLNWAFFYFTSKTPNSQNLPADTSRLEKILERGSIRCSYINYAPYFATDPNTGQHSGIFYEVVEEIGNRAKLQIDWVEEVGYEVIFTGLNSGRHDVFCGGLWANTTRAKAALFSTPVFYSVIKAWVRTEDHRFDENLVLVNNSKIKIATIDGAMEDIIADADFPAAQKESLPQLSPFTQNLQNIISKKADITFAEPGIIFEFLKNNPGSLREAAPSSPLRIFGNSLVSPMGETELAAFLNIAMTELLYSGFIDKVLNKYEATPGIFPRAQLPYQPETAILKTD